MHGTGAVVAAAAADKVKTAPSRLAVAFNACSTFSAAPATAAEALAACASVAFAAMPDVAKLSHPAVATESPANFTTAGQKWSATLVNG
jgi:hypothetical protein